MSPRVSAAALPAPVEKKDKKEKKRKRKRDRTETQDSVGPLPKASKLDTGAAASQSAAPRTEELGSVASSTRDAKGPQVQRQQVSAAGLPRSPTRFPKASMPEGGKRTTEHIVEISDEESAAFAPPVLPAPAVPLPAASPPPAQTESETVTKRWRRRRPGAAPVSSSLPPTAVAAVASQPSNQTAAGKQPAADGPQAQGAATSSTQSQEDLRAALQARMISTQKEILRLRLQAKQQEVAKLRTKLKNKYLNALGNRYVRPIAVKRTPERSTLDGDQRDPTPVILCPEIASVSSKGPPAILPGAAGTPRSVLASNLQNLLASHTEKLRQMKEMVAKRKQVLAKSGGAPPADKAATAQTFAAGTSIALAAAAAAGVAAAPPRSSDAATGTGSGATAVVGDVGSASEGSEADSDYDYSDSSYSVDVNAMQ